MKNLDIIIAPDKKLKKIAEPMAEIDRSIKLVLQKMINKMYESKGIGLAGPQVGISKRILVMDCSSEEEEKRPYKIINPEILSISEKFSDFEEGCLSLPHQYASVSRPQTVKIRYINELSETVEKIFSGIEATCVQHEIDHLNGILFVDHISRLKRNMILKKLKKYKALNKDKFLSKV